MENLITYSEVINSPIDHVWKHLLLKTEHPEKFIPAISNVEILDRTPNYIIRKMEISVHGNDVTFVEKILTKPYTVRYDIIEHPSNIGHVENIAESVDPNKTKLIYTMAWENKITHDSANNPDMLKAAVLQSKKFIEENPI